jgi:hypothetical protein
MGEPVDVGMPRPAIDLDGQPVDHKSDVDPVLDPGQHHPVIGHPAVDPGLPEQPVQDPFGLRARPVRCFPQYPPQPRRPMPAKRTVTSAAAGAQSRSPHHHAAVSPLATAPAPAHATAARVSARWSGSRRPTR